MKKDIIVHLSLDPRLARVYEKQRGLQMFLLGKEPEDLDLKEKAEYFRTQALAMVAETMELLEETNWKPWASPPADGGFVDSPKRFTGEAADTFIFFMNLMLASGINTTELLEAVEAKQDKNLVRWTTNYDAKNKCPACRRSYDDEGVDCYPRKKSAGILDFCAVAGRFLDKDGVTV